MTQKQLSRFMLDLDEWDNEDKRIFDISAGNPITPEGDNTYVFTSFKLSKSQYSELLDELQSYYEGSDGHSKIFEITEPPNDENFVLSYNHLDDINVQLFFENKNEILEFQHFLSENK